MKKIEIEVWKIFAILAIVFGMVAIPLTVMAIHYGVNYERNCSAHIWNASRSSTPELAAEELTKAIDYMQANKMTFGTSTSGASKNNVGWFYESLVSARDNLENFHETSSEESYYLEIKVFIKSQFIKEEVVVSAPEKLFSFVKSDKKVKGEVLNFALLDGKSHLDIYPIKLDNDIYQIFVEYLNLTHQYFAS